MAESHVITGLVAKRSELSGLLEHHRKEIDRLAEEIKTLDSAIKLFDPDYRTRSIKPKRYQRKNHFFKNGEASRMTLDVLREAGKPISTNEIAKAIMDAKGIEAGNERPLQAAILTTLHRQSKKGLVEIAGKEPSGACVWGLMS